MGKELKEFMVNVDVVDPYASSKEIEDEYGCKLKKDNNINNYDAVVIAVNHDQYKDLNDEFFKKALNDNGFVVDVKGVFRNKLNGIKYWSL